MNAHCIVDWIREIIRYKNADAQLTMDKLWEAKDDGSLTNKLKHYPLGSFNHTAHKVWNKLPVDIKSMEKNANLSSKQNCKRIMYAIKKADFFKKELFKSVEEPARVKQEKAKMRRHNEKAFAEGRLLQIKSLDECWARNDQHLRNTY